VSIYQQVKKKLKIYMNSVLVNLSVMDVEIIYYVNLVEYVELQKNLYPKLEYTLMLSMKYTNRIVRIWEL